MMAEGLSVTATKPGNAEQNKKGARGIKPGAGGL